MSRFLPFPRCFLALMLVSILLCSTTYSQDPLKPSEINRALSVTKDKDTDSSELLQRLVHTSKGLVKIPAGSYTITKPIVVDLTQTGFRGIRGAGGATRIIMIGAGPAFRIVGNHQGTADPNSFKDRTWEGERFPVISDIEILGKHQKADGIALFRTMQCTIQNVSIRDCRYGIHLQERNRNVLIANSHIYNGRDTGIFMDKCNLHQINIIGNHISYNKRAGIRQLDGDVHNVQITGNDIEYYWGSNETSGEIVLEAPEGIISEYTIASNTIQALAQNPGANIYVVGAKKDSPFAARLLSITGNVMGSRNKNLYIENASKVTVTGNTIYGAVTYNTHIKSSQGLVLSSNTIGTRPSAHWGAERYTDGVLFEQSSDCIINGNIMNGLLSGSKEGGGSVHLKGSDYIRIADNQIVNPKYRGIHIEGGEACVVSDNTIAERDEAQMISAIEVSGKAQGHLVQDNLLRSSLRSPIDVQTGSAQVRENVIQVIKAKPAAEKAPEKP